MIEGLIGFVIGGILFWCSAKIDCHRHRTKHRVELEQQYLKLQQHVDAAVGCISNIIDGSRHE